MSLLLIEPTLAQIATAINAVFTKPLALYTVGGGFVGRALFVDSRNGAHILWEPNTNGTPVITEVDFLVAFPGSVVVAGITTT